jgi:hypothetical protein
MKGKYFLVAIAIAAFFFTLSANAERSRQTIKLDLKLQQSSRQGVFSDGKVAISRIVDKRSFGQDVIQNNVASEVLVGRYDSSNSIYDVILIREKTNESITEEIINAAFENIGYEVIDLGAMKTSTVPVVEIHIEKFWIDRDTRHSSGSSQYRKRFNFNIALRLVSEDPLLGSIGVVKASGYRNGRSSRSPKSYSNTINYTLKEFYKDFEVRYERAVTQNSAVISIHENAEDEYIDDDLVEDLMGAQELHEKGALTDEEYTMLKNKLLNR